MALRRPRCTTTTRHDTTPADVSADAWITLGVVVATIALLATERLPAAMTMFGSALSLLLLGVLDEEQAFSGFSNPAPITIAGLYVLAGAAEITGALGSLTDRSLDERPGRSERASLARLLYPVALSSGLIANTPLIGILAPRVSSWARRTGRSPSRYLMPLSFAAVLGGVITVIGTSTNLVVSGLLADRGMEPLGFFEITKVGLPIALAGVTLLVLIAPRLLPDRAPAQQSLEATAREFTLEMRVMQGGAVDGKSVDAAGLRHLEGVFLVALERAGDTIAPVAPDRVLIAGDRLTFAGNIDQVLDLQRLSGLESQEHRHFDVLGTGPGRQVYEAVIAERSGLVGSTLRDVDFRNHFGAAVLAVHRAGERVSGKLGSVRMRAGDVLLVLADADFGERWRDGHDFLVLSATDGAAPHRRDRARLVEAATLFLIITSATGVLSLTEAALVTAVGLLGFGVLTPTEAGRSIDTNVLVIMASSIALGTAVETSGLASEVARIVLATFDGYGTVGVLAAILLATIVATELLSNNAAAALMLPIALSTAAQASYEPRALAIVVLIGASCSFLTPIGYQTNTMVYGMGGYRFTDFTKAGAPLTLLVAVLTLLLVPVAFPL